MNHTMSSLRVKGTQLVNLNNDQVILRGAGLGGWMWFVFSFLPELVDLDEKNRSMENFISGASYLSLA